MQSTERYHDTVQDKVSYSNNYYYCMIYSSSNRPLTHIDNNNAKPPEKIVVELSLSPQVKLKKLFYCKCGTCNLKLRNTQEPDNIFIPENTVYLLFIIYYAHEHQNSMIFYSGIKMISEQ